MNGWASEPRDSIAACLIVKDAIETIELCLQSIRPFVDEINVFDTSSSDGTFELLSRAAATGQAEDATIRIKRGRGETTSPGRLGNHEVVGAGELKRLAFEATPDVDGFLVYSTRRGTPMTT